MHKLSVDVLTAKAAHLSDLSGNVTLTKLRSLPTYKQDARQRSMPPGTMQALKRADTSVKAYRSTDYRMYSSFMSTMREMQQDTYTQQQHHHLQQQPPHQAPRQQQQQEGETLANLRGAWRRVSPAVEELMSSVAPEAPAVGSPEASALSLPW